MVAATEQERAGFSYFISYFYLHFFPSTLEQLVLFLSSSSLSISEAAQESKHRHNSHIQLECKEESNGLFVLCWMYPPHLGSVEHFLPACVFTRRLLNSSKCSLSDAGLYHKWNLHFRNTYCFTFIFSKCLFTGDVVLHSDIIAHYTRSNHIFNGKPETFSWVNTVKINLKYDDFPPRCNLGKRLRKSFPCKAPEGA